MDPKSIREDAKLYFLPVILGGGSSARRIASRIYRKYGSVSYILSDKSSPADVFSLTYRHISLPKGAHSELVAEVLISLCGQNPNTLPILIPTSAEYADLCEDMRDLLEAYFVFSDPVSILTDSPLTRTRAKNHKGGEILE